MSPRRITWVCFGIKIGSVGVVVPRTAGLVVGKMILISGKVEVAVEVAVIGRFIKVEVA